MKNQLFILSGIAIFILGFILDKNLIRHSYLIIHLGTIITIIGCLNWLRKSENRQSFKENLFARGFMKIFNFSWSRVSLMWTFCAIVFMFIVHASALGMRSSGAYKEAVRYLKADKNIINQTGEILDFTYLITGNATSEGRSNLNFGIIGEKKNIKVSVAVNGSDGVYITKRIGVEN